MVAFNRPMDSVNSTTIFVLLCIVIPFSESLNAILPITGGVISRVKFSLDVPITPVSCLVAVTTIVHC